MSKTYAIADLHGRYDLLEKAGALAQRHARLEDGEPGTIVTLGDYIDRGPQSRQVIERLMLGIPAPWKLICLKGNHEEMMLETIRKPLAFEWWHSNGGSATLISYGAKVGDLFDGSIVPAAHLDWIAALPYMHVDKHRVYVHAGVSSQFPLDGQPSELLTWKCYKDTDEGGHGLRHVVHGHHFHEDGPLLKKGRCALDTNAWRTGRLVVGVFDDDIPGGPVDLIEIKGEPA